MNEVIRPEVSGSSVRYLRRNEAARYIQAVYGFSCSRQWLAKLAVVGGGPVYHKAGRTPIYAPEELDKWALSRIGKPQRSSFDVGPKSGQEG